MNRRLTSLPLLLLLGCLGAGAAAQAREGWPCQRWNVSGDGVWTLEGGVVTNHAFIVESESSDPAGSGSVWCPRVPDTYFVLNSIETVFGILTAERAPPGFSLLDVPYQPKAFVWSRGALASQAGPVVNCSMRARVAPGSEVIAGFVCAKPARFLLRAVGPGLLPHGVADAAPNPFLRLFCGADHVVENDDWWLGNDNTAETRLVRRRMKETGLVESSDPLNAWSGNWVMREEDVTHIRSAERAVGAFPLSASSLDAALLVELAPGAYTLVVESEEPGVVLAEAYQVPD